MKLNQNNKQERIIGTDDIFISSNNSNLGNSLESVLSKQDLDILDLKRNVKWLYKYGGVGGNGGGSSVTNTKMSCSLSYIDINGNKVENKIEDNSYYTILEGSQITVTCTITSKKSLNEYAFSLNNLKTTIKATDANGSLSTSPSGNTLYTVTLAGETTVSLSFTIFTKVVELSHLIELSNGITIQNNSSIYSSQIDDALYIFTLVNNLPNNFEQSIDSIYINSTLIDSSQYTIIESVNTLTNQKTTKINVPLKGLFTDYGIYSISVNYTFGLDSLSITDQFIYQSEHAFLYCWADSIRVYNKLEESPETSNNYNNILNYRIYPAKADSITLNYSLQISVGNHATELTAQAGTKYYYTVVNEVNTEGTFETPITFTLDGVSYTYYIYLEKPKDTVYFFETDLGLKYYKAISCDTENPNKSIIEFPEKDYTIAGAPITISKEIETPIKLISLYFGTLKADDLVSNFIQSSPTDVGTLRVDALFSFGILYGGNNQDLPIIGIKNKDNAGSKIINIYKNKIVFNDLSLEICIPNDGTYHLVLLYIKSDYKVTNEENTININNTLQALVLYIDGVLETKPFEINLFFILQLSNLVSTSIVYYPGMWKFNHIGVATFNGIPTSLWTTVFSLKCVAKYLLDFDPIIPANYYQTYRTQILGDVVNQKFDRTIYDALSINSSSKNGGPLWINYFNYNLEEEAHLNKFVNINPQIIADLAPSDMEVYCIVPESTSLDLQESGFDSVPDKHLNLFLYNTFKSYGENDLITKVACSLQKWKTDKWVDFISNNGQDPILFYVKYLGSSTLLYSAKNFEIGTYPILNLDQEELPVYFTPDVDLFPYMESSFNLKADIVDSSHSNNVVIGNFVNDYMTSPFNTTKKTYKSCLTGKPILLFIKNNAIDPTDNKTILDDSYIYLGIYSLNLNRGSVHNLGYSTLLDSSGNEITTTSNKVTDERCCDNITKFHILQQTEKDFSANDIAVGEVQGNGILFDYSQYDNTLLANLILGDFYISNNNKISKEYSSAFVKPFKVLSLIIYNYIVKLNLFHTVDFTEIFKGRKDLEKAEEYFYTNDLGTLISIPSDGIIVSSNEISNLTEGVPYHTFDSLSTDNKVVLINNPLQQFHLICDKDGNPVLIQNTKYYYLENLSTLIYDSENPEARIDVEAAVKYYITCMAFAMVDSVLKNLTIKCPDTKNNNIWYPAFYDMDTAFGISNSGGNTSFQAFSDYVDDSGIIILDYSPIHSSTLFDTPSSFLFLYAKYIDIITNGNTMSNTDTGIYPYLEWSKLRSVGGKFESGTKFCLKYIDNYFGDINPLLWNLNYQYKYFGETKNTNNSDNESGRFNGTRRFARKEYLNLRFRYLDVMFGFKNNKSIGLSNTLNITNKSTSIPGNPDIKINNTMFEQFTKGVSGTINVEILEYPKTPIVLLTSINTSKLYMTDSSGHAIIKGNISTNEDCGFYGTTELLSLNECGQFLVNTEKSNTIKNNSIKILNITASPSSKTASIVIDLNNCINVESINISSSSRLYYNSITIKNNGEFKSITLVVLNNIQCNNINLNNFGTNKLTISNISATSLSVNKVDCDLLTYSGNYFITESWQEFNTSLSLNLVNTTCQSLSITDSKIANLTYTPSRLLSILSLERVTINEFILNSSDNISSIVAKNININTFKINADYNLNPTCPIEGTLALGFTNTEASLSIPGLSNITSITLGNLTSCNLLNNAFSDCSKLLSLPSNVTFTIKGDKVFRRTHAMSLDSMLKCVLPSDHNYLGLFLFNKNVNTKFVQEWFKTKTANSLDLLFCGCPNITMQYDVTNGKPSEDFKTFEKYFIESVSRTSNMASSIVGLFNLSSVNVFTKVIADALTSKGVKSINSILGRGSSNTNAFGSILFFETLSLNNFELVTLSGYGLENSGHILLINAFNDDGVITEVKISDYFNDSCKIQSLYEFNPVMYSSSNNPYGKEVSMDFSDSFPASMKRISMCKPTTDINVVNLEKAFDKVSNCTLSNYSFWNTPCSSDKPYETYTDLFEMLFKTTSSGIVPKISINFSSDTASGAYFSFPKKLTQENLYKILSYYSNTTTNISWLFRGTTIYLCSNNHFLDYKLSKFKTLVYTFSYCTFKDEEDNDIALNIDKAFATEGSSKTTEVNNLECTFINCSLVKFAAKLPIRNVSNMRGTFYNCSFTLQSSLKSPISVWEPEGIYSIKPYTDKEFLILPDDFFTVCTTSCDLTNCFKCSSFSVARLTGYLPNSDTLGLSDISKKGAILHSLFSNCNITFYPMEESGKYRIFPNWYNLLVFTNKYNVFIPFTTRVDGNRVYLFESASSILGNYNTLPNMPDVQSGSAAYYTRVTGSNANQLCDLKVSPQEDTFPTLAGTDTYKNMLPYRLSLLLRFSTAPTEVITGMANLLKKGDSVMSNSKPIIPSLESNNSSVIFNGTEIDSTVKSYVLPI